MIDCIIKLGGAAITVKDQIETLQPDTIAAVADLISRLRTFGKSVIIVHGAGSFGHQHAAAAGLGKTEHRLASPDEVAAGVAATRLALLKLHQAVLSELISKNVPAVGLSPLAMGFSSSKSVEGSMFSTIPRLLSRRLVPVLHGDVVLDNSTKTKFSIFGGDVIMTQLCREFEPQFAVFLTNVKGIYDRPPNGDSSANLLRKIQVGMPAEGAWQAFDQHGAPVAACRIQTDVVDHDTTGGVLAKVEEAVEIAMMGVATRIVKAGSGEALEACLMEQLGDNWIGTEIVRTIDEKLK